MLNRQQKLPTPDAYRCLEQPAPAGPKVLVADKFEPTALGALEAIGCIVTSDPELTAETLAGAVAEHDPEVLIVRSTKVRPPVFEAAGKLNKLEAFASLNGPAYYGLPANEDTITLVKGDPVTYPAHIDTGEGPVTVFDPGFDLHWRVES